MSVKSQIDRLNAVKERIRTNLVAQGVTVPADAMLEEMATMILSVAGEKGEPGIVWKGEYNSSHGYLIGDAVEYVGSSYVCVENNGGSEPSVSPSEASQTAWQLLASAGKNGNDYVLTNSDKNIIVNAVIAALPVYAGEVL